MLQSGEISGKKGASCVKSEDKTWDDVGSAPSVAAS